MSDSGGPLSAGFLIHLLQRDLAYCAVCVQTIMGDGEFDHITVNNIVGHLRE